MESCVTSDVVLVLFLTSWLTRSSPAPAGYWEMILPTGWPSTSIGSFNVSRISCSRSFWTASLTLSAEICCIACDVGTAVKSRFSSVRVEITKNAAMATTSHSRGFLSRRLRSMLIGLGGLDLPDCADCHHGACIPWKRRADTTSYQRTALAEATPTRTRAQLDSPEHDTLFL